jgi:hypothetical protein
MSANRERIANSSPPDPDQKSRCSNLSVVSPIDRVVVVRHVIRNGPPVNRRVVFLPAFAVTHPFGYNPEEEHAWATENQCWRFGSTTRRMS